MGDIEVVIGKIRGAFAGNEHPGGRYLQGSFEGCEPYEEVGPFEKDAALQSFWLERTRTAPQAESLKQYLAEQEEYLAAISSQIEKGTEER